MSTTTVPSQYVLPDGEVLSSATIDDIRRSLRVLGEGASRRAYALSEAAVLKVDTGDTWCGNCKSEITAWVKLSTSEVAQYLAPILAGDPEAGWLVMARAESTNTAGRQAQNFLPSNLLADHGIRDLHGANVGWITTETGEEVPVAIDYAFNGESRGDGCEYSDDDDDDDDSENCQCSECLAGSRTRCHNAGETCGNGTCEDCHSLRAVRHHLGTTCCETGMHGLLPVRAVLRGPGILQRSP